MGIIIGALEFDGPFFDTELLLAQPGLVAVLCEAAEEFELIELNVAEDVREYIVSHPDRRNWQENRLVLSLAVHYAPDLTSAERAQIKDTLERELDLTELEVAS